MKASDAVNSDLMPANQVNVFWSKILLCWVMCLWCFAYWPDLKTAIHTWSVSEIFHHCFLVIPTAIYLAWTKNKEMGDLHLSMNFVPSYLILLPLFAITFVGVFAHAGKIAVIGHIAAFSSLSMMIVFVIGIRMAMQFMFPILFVLFSIPIGEELIPILQDITADLAVYMLGFTGIPIFNNGLYIEIPGGRFVVAEACSGISFLIVSIVFGSVYSYLGFKRRSKQIAFVLISIGFPILANALRVFGIILVGHYSNMEHATGADHIVYGAVFFSFVLFCLYLIGNMMGGDIRASVPRTDQQASLEDFFNAAANRALWVLSGLLFVTIVWKSFIDTHLDATQTERPDLDRISANSLLNIGNWQPQFPQADYRYYSLVPTVVKDLETDSALDSNMELWPELFVAWYPKTDDNEELIARDNRFYRVDNWSQDSKKSLSIPYQDRTIQMTMLKVYSPQAKARYIAYWYVSEFLEHGNKVFTKLSQTLDIVLNGSGSGAVIAISLDEAALRGQSFERVLPGFVQQVYPEILDQIGAKH